MMRTGLVLVAALLFSVPAMGADAPATRPATRPGMRAAREAQGTLNRIDEKSLVITLREPEGDTKEKTVSTADRVVRAVVDFEQAQLSDLKPGMQVTASVFNRPGGTSLFIFARSPSLRGTIDSIDGTTLTINVPKEEGQTEKVKVKTDEKTRVIFLPLTGNRKVLDRGGERKFADLVVKMQVMVIPPDGTATKVVARPIPPPAGGF